MLNKWLYEKFTPQFPLWPEKMTTHMKIYIYHNISESIQVQVDTSQTNKSTYLTHKTLGKQEKYPQPSMSEPMSTSDWSFVRWRLHSSASENKCGTSCLRLHLLYRYHRCEILHVWCTKPLFNELKAQTRITHFTPSPHKLAELPLQTQPWQITLSDHVSQNDKAALFRKNVAGNLWCPRSRPFFQ